jgi:cytochrome c-type biogenesis protein CcmF
MMATVGRALLILALAVALYGIAASIYGAVKGRDEWIASGRRSVYALAGTVVTAFVILEAAFLRSDFSFQLVFSHSSTTTPTFYRLAAAWSSQEGSLLLWLLLLSLWSSAVLFLTRKRLRRTRPRCCSASARSSRRCWCSSRRRSSRSSAPCRARAWASTRCCGTRA